MRNEQSRCSNVCRGGAELLFDGKKRHEVDLPGEECKRRHVASLLLVSVPPLSLMITDRFHRDAETTTALAAG